MELARAIMCAANCVAPQSIVAGCERRDVLLHPDTVTPGAFLDRPSLLRVRGERPRRRRSAEKGDELASSHLKNLCDEPEQSITPRSEERRVGKECRSRW